MRHNPAGVADSASRAEYIKSQALTSTPIFNQDG